MEQKITISNPNNFDEEINNIVKEYEKKTIYVLFYGDWCPDCINATPIIQKYFNNKKSDSVLVEASVGTRAEYANSPFKIHHRIELEKIPTLIKWSTDKANDNRLVENECMNESLMSGFFSD